MLPTLPTAPQSAASTRGGAYHPNPSVFHGISFIVLALYVFLLHGRIHEYLFPNVRILAVVFGLCCIGVVLGGSLGRVLSSPVIRLIALLLVWMTLSTPFSVWKGGSVTHVKDFLIPLFPCFAITCLALTFDNIRGLIYTIAAGIFTLSTVSFFLGDSLSEGRLQVGKGLGLYGNANDLAQIMAMGIPLAGFVYLDSDHKVLRKILSVVAMGSMLLVTVKTGSRGGALALVVMTTLILLRTSIAGKLRLLVALGTCVALLTVLVPSRTIYRLGVVFSPPTRDRLTVDEADSAINAAATGTQRWQLFRESLLLTARNPLFGVGPGMFAVAMREVYEEKAVARPWQVTHNAYTQWSSECGIPALLFLIWGIVKAYVSSRRVWKSCRSAPQGSEPARFSDAALCLNLSLVTWIVSALFLSIAYGHQFFTLAALVSALCEAVKTSTSLSPLPLSPGLQGRDNGEVEQRIAVSARRRLEFR